MMIDKRGLVAFMSAALATTCDAFSLVVTPGVMEEKALHIQRRQKPLRAFASDRGDTNSQHEHFAISSDPSSAPTLSQESTTTPIAPPPMARPAENNKIAMVDKNTNGARAAAPPADVEGESQPVERKQSVWERNKAADVQGGSLRTWSFADQHKIDMVQVHMKTDGRPMNANVELWQGPDNVPQKVAVYVEDGRARPFRCFLATPYSGNSVSIRNTNTLEYPLQAILEGGKVGLDDPETQKKMQQIQATKPKMCQGGAVITERFQPEVQSVQVFLQSEGRPLQCRIELIQGPNNVKQVMEVYTEEGSTRPFYAIMETPGYGTGVVRIINSSTMEFPFTATVQPWDIGLPDDDFDASSTGGGSPFFEISGGPEGMGIGNNNNLRSVGNPTSDMGGMFGSFAISDSSLASAPTVTESQRGGLAGLFDSPTPAVERKMISSKKSSPPPPPTKSEPEAEPSPIFLQNEEFANSSSTSSLSQDTTPVIPTTVANKMASPKKSSTIPMPEVADPEVESESEVEPEPTPITKRYVPPSPPAPAAPVTKRYIAPPSSAPKTPVTKRYVPPSSPGPPAAPVTKRYVPPPAPAPKKSSHVFLDIDDVYK